ncbi:MAG: hypothetical protein AMXMBFR13_23950 [Phycisphaerae bacterium]
MVGLDQEMAYVLDTRFRNMTFASFCVACFWPGPGALGYAGTREEFARAMAEVEIGMSPDEVRQILGEPDDTRDERDPGSLGSSDTKEVWCYGARRHLEFPTLGQVHFNVNDAVQLVCGGSVLPPPVSVVPEEELRCLLVLIDSAPSEIGPYYNPRDLITSVNGLLPSGKDKILTAMEEYVRVTPPWHKGSFHLLFLLRVLFDPPDAHNRPVLFMAGWNPPVPKRLARVPRFPIVIVLDIPLLLAIGYLFDGKPPDIREDLRSIRTHGRIRSEPLRPTNRPLEVLSKLEASCQWFYGKNYPALAPAFEFVEPEYEVHDGRQALMNQLLAMVSSVYAVPQDCYGTRLSALEPGELEAKWEHIQRKFEKLAIRWDVAKSCYVFSDGSLLPEQTRSYQRKIWKPVLDGVQIKWIAQRRSPACVEVSLEYDTGQRVSGRFRVSTKTEDGAEVLAQLSVGGLLSGRALSQSEEYYSESRMLDIPEGTVLQVDLLKGWRTVDSYSTQP